MSKIMYKKPSAEFVQFENEDIITTSPTTCPIGKGGILQCIFETGGGQWGTDLLDDNGGSGVWK